MTDPKKSAFTIVPAPVDDPGEVWMNAAKALVPEGLHVVMVTATNVPSGGILVGAKSSMDRATAVMVLERALVCMRAQLAQGN